jgi:hypothetical protein
MADKKKREPCQADDGSETAVTVLVSVKTQRYNTLCIPHFIIINIVELVTILGNELVIFPTL